MTESSLSREIREALEATKPPSPSVSWRSAVVIIGCITVMALIAVAALYQWGSDKADRLDDLEASTQLTAAQQECRSAIAADDAVAQGNKQLTSQRLLELVAAAIVARDPDTPDAERQLWADALDNVRATFIADVQASHVRFEQAQRRLRVNELCVSGEIPEPQVQPLPVDPIVQLPNN